MKNKYNKYEIGLISLLTGNNTKYIKDVIDGKIEQPSSKNNWWGLGADEYYQGVIEGIVKAFKRLFYTYVVITVLVALVLSLIK